MSQPPPYVPATAFVSYQAQQSWFPGQQLDAEFNNLDDIIGDIEADLALIQRDDGALANGVVTYQALSPTLQTAGLSPLTVWATGTRYIVPQAILFGSSLYQCAIANTAGVFSTDLANGCWTLLANLSILSGAANVSANFVAAGPVSGSPASPAFRKLVSADLPSAPTTAGNWTFTGFVEIDLNTGALPTPQTGAVLQVGNVNSTISRLEADAFAAAAHFTGMRSEGTAAAPTAVASGSEIASFNAGGHNGTTWVEPRGAFRIYANQAWTTGANGTYCDITTTPNGATAAVEVVRFENDGGITVPSTVTGGDKGVGTINAGGLYVNGTAVTLGNVAAVAHEWINSISSTGVATQTQPAASDLSNGVTGSGAVVLATSPTMTTPALGVATATSLNGLTITTSTGTLTIANGKTLTLNNTITFAGTDATTVTFQGTDTYVGRATTDTLTNKTFDTAGTGNVFKINGTQISANTGTGSNVLANSPALVTPTLGVATATSLNGLTITTSTGTLTISNGKTHAVSNSLTFTGTDATSFAFPGTSDTVATLAATQTLTNKTISGGTLSGTLAGTPTLSGANFVTNANLGTAVTGTIKSNIAGSTGSVSDNTITSVLDNLFGTTQGSVIYRGASAWSALTPGTAGQFFTTQGTSANPNWSSGGAGTGTVTNVGSGTGLTGGPISASGTLAVSLSKITNSLASDVALTVASTYYDGPSVAQGTSGTWFASGTVTLIDTVGVGVFNVKLWDGTTVIASAHAASPAGGSATTLALSGCLSTPAGNIKMSVADTASTAGLIKYNLSGTTMDSTITVVRIA